jgi:hypothetical protein
MGRKWVGLDLPALDCLFSHLSILSTLLSQTVSTTVLPSFLCCRAYHSPSAPNSNHHRSNHTPRRLAEAERLVPGLQELDAADPSVHAALGGRSALAVRRGSEAEELIRFYKNRLVCQDLNESTLDLSFSLKAHDDGDHGPGCIT